MHLMRDTRILIGRGKKLCYYAGKTLFRDQGNSADYLGF
jgi:hypothetical protein